MPQNISDSQQSECGSETCSVPLQDENLIINKAAAPAIDENLIINKAASPSPEEQAVISSLRNEMRLAGRQTFLSPTGEAVNWTVDRVTAAEVIGSVPTREKNVFTASGATATFDLTKIPEKETVYEITTSGNNSTETITVRVFPANEMASFVYKSEGNKDVKVYLIVPQTLSPKTRLISIIHDSGRSSESGLSVWAKWLTENDYIGIAPEFPYSDWSNGAFNEGNIFLGDDGIGSRNPKSKWTFTIADDIANMALTDFKLTNKEYDMFGHSGGARFTHRFMMFMPEAKIRFGFPANPGLWTLPSLTTRFPWGLKHPHFSYTEKDLLAWTNRKMIIVRGIDDVVRDYGIDTTPEGDAQGPHRFARAQLAYDLAKAANPNLNWELLDVPNCGHNGWCTAVAAQNYLEAHDANQPN